MILQRELVTEAVKLMVAGSSGKLADVASAPDGADLKKGYYVLHSIPGGRYPDDESELALVAPNETVEIVYQVDGVAATYAQAEWLGDRVRHVFLARTSSGAFQVPFQPPAGWKCIDRRPDGGPGGVDVVGIKPNAVYTVVERFALAFTPN